MKNFNKNIDLIKTSGFTLLSDYKSEIKVQCDQGHVKSVPARVFMRMLQKGEPACTPCALTKDLITLDLKWISGEANSKLSEVEVQCSRCSYQFKTKISYIRIAVKRGTKGCLSCRDSDHSLRGKERFFTKLKEAGYLPLEEYKNARTKIKIQRISDGAINFVTAMDINTGRFWPKPPSLRHTRGSLQAWLDVNKTGYKILDCSKYLDQYSTVTLECPQGHPYETRWGVAKTCFCPTCCLHGTSLEEKSLQQFLESLGVIVTPHYTNYTEGRTVHSLQKEFDFFIEEKKLMIEYQGVFYHSQVEPSYHFEKVALAELNRAKFLAIFSDEWAKEKPRLENRIKDLMGLFSFSFNESQVSLVTQEQVFNFFSKYGRIKDCTISTNINYGLFNESILIAVVGIKDNRIERFAVKENIPFESALDTILQKIPFKTLEYFLDLSYGQTPPRSAELIKFIDPIPHAVRSNKKIALYKPNESPKLELIPSLKEQGYQILFDCGYRHYKIKTHSC